MKKQKSLIIIIIIIMISMIPFYKVKALIEGTEIGSRTIRYTNSLNGAVVFDRPLYVNYGYGTIITSMSVSCGPNVNCANTSIKSVTITRSTDYQHFACDIGNNMSYQDSSMLNTTYTVKCPIDFTNNKGLYAIDIVITTLGSGERYVNLSNFLTFVSQDSTEISNAINNNTQADQENWDNFNNTDISTDDKDPADTSAYNSTNQTEQDIYDTLFTNAPDPGTVLNFTIDEQSNSWIWGTMQNLMQTNARIIGMFVAILSIGVAKLIMSR